MSLSTPLGRVPSQPDAGLLITGARGFVGSALIAAARDWRIHAVSRDAAPVPGANRTFKVAKPDSVSDWSAALVGCQAVVHLAAQVHVMGAARQQQAELYHAVNVHATLRLAQAAAEAGVRRFVFVSSAKVLGEYSSPGQPFTDASVPAPMDPYAVSKLQAELALFELAARSEMEVVVLRPPLVYGPGVKANFHALMRAVDRSMPLPLAMLHSRRTFCYLGNLVDVILLSLQHPAAAGRTFLVADGETLSLSDFARQLATAMGHQGWQWPVPEKLLQLAGALFGRQESVRRLIESFEIDTIGVRTTLGWTAPYSVAAAITETAAAWRAAHGT